MHKIISALLLTLTCGVSFADATSERALSGVWQSHDGLPGTISFVYKKSGKVVRTVELAPKGYPSLRGTYEAEAGSLRITPAAADGRAPARMLYTLSTKDKRLTLHYSSQEKQEFRKR